MKKILFLMSLTLTSCATIFNSSTMDVKIHTNKKASLEYKGKLYSLDKGKPVDLLVKREKKPLEFNVEVDSNSLKVTKASHLSSAVLANLGISYFGIPFFIVDLFSGKRFGHHSNYYVDVAKGKARNYNFFPKKGRLNLVLSLPYLNKFKLRGKHIDESSVGFWGAGLGLEYYHKDHQYLGINNDFYANYFFLFPANIGVWGLSDEDKILQNTFSLTNNHELNRFSLGYGPSLTYSTYEQGVNGYHDDDIVYGYSYNYSKIKERQLLLGLALPLQVSLGRTFKLGVVYRPNFFQLDNGFKYQYQDSWSLNFSWHLPIIKK